MRNYFFLETIVAGVRSNFYYKLLHDDILIAYPFQNIFYRLYVLPFCYDSPNIFLF